MSSLTLSRWPMHALFAAVGAAAFGCGESEHVAVSAKPALPAKAAPRRLDAPFSPISRAKRIAESIGRVQSSAATKHAWVATGESDPAAVTFASESTVGARLGAGAVNIAARSSGKSKRGATEYFNLALGAWGCIDQLQPLPPSPPVRDADAPNRLRYEHAEAGISEWYLSGPLGLEQGFIVSRLPACSATGRPLILRIPGSSGWKSLQKRSSVEMVGPSQQHLLYGHAFSEDARGLELPTSVRADGSGLVVEVSAWGAVLPIRIDPLTWTKTDRLEAPSGEPGDGFGRAVALSETTILAGAGSLTVLELPGAGRAYSYARGSLSEPPQELVPLVAEEQARFGASVATYGDLAVVGAPGMRDGTVNGSVYVFTRMSSEAPWGAGQKLLPGAHSAPGDQFGVSVALFENTLLVGAAGNAEMATGGGAAFVFVRKNGAWSTAQPLAIECQHPLPAGQSEPFTLTDHAFGRSVAIRNGTALVGAPSRGTEGSCPTSAYIYEVSANGDPSLPQLLRHSIPEDELELQQATDGFGNGVTLSDDKFLVSATGLDLDTEGLHVGAAYVYERATAPNTDAIRLIAPSNTSFGSALAASNDVLAISQPNADPPEFAGVYLYPARSPEEWGAPRFFGPDADAYTAQPGAAVAVDGISVLVGNYDGVEPASLRLLLLTPGSECGAARDCQSGHCVDGVCCDSECDNGCSSCLNEHTGDADGFCAPVSKNSDPRGACAPPTCSSTREEALTATCDGAGACLPHAKACDPYNCSGHACSTSCEGDEDCNGRGFCRGGECLPVRKAALACSRSEECASGVCADSVCCSEPCEGQCEACDVAGSEGQCVAVSGLPHGDRAACPPIAAEEPCSRMACDGRSTDTCAAFVGTEVTCDEPACAEGLLPRLGVCDGLGQCDIGLANVCKADCESSYDCQSGFDCDTRTNKCVALSAANSNGNGAGCALAPSRPPSPSAWLLPIALTTLAGSRRRKLLMRIG